MNNLLKSEELKYKYLKVINNVIKLMKINTLKQSGAHIPIPNNLRVLEATDTVKGAVNLLETATRIVQATTTAIKTATDAADTAFKLVKVADEEEAAVEPKAEAKAKAIAAVKATNAAHVVKEVSMKAKQFANEANSILAAAKDSIELHADAYNAKNRAESRMRSVPRTDATYYQELKITKEADQIEQILKAEIEAIEGLALSVIALSHIYKITTTFANRAQMNGKSADEIKDIIKKTTDDNNISLTLVEFEAAKKNVEATKERAAAYTAATVATDAANAATAAVNAAKKVAVDAADAVEAIKKPIGAIDKAADIVASYKATTDKAATEKAAADEAVKNAEIEFSAANAAALKATEKLSIATKAAIMAADAANKAAAKSRAAAKAKAAAEAKAT